MMCHVLFNRKNLAIFVANLQLFLLILFRISVNTNRV